MADIVVRAGALTKTYSEENEKLEVLKGIDLEIRKGETVALMGPSGAGKSTLLHILGLMDSASSGNLELMGRKIEDLSETEADAIRNTQVGFLFQFHYLLPGLTLLENSALPLRIAGMENVQALQAAQGLLKSVGLEDRAHHLPSRVSGGEQQRAALARAMAAHPKFLICDEPTGNLDLERGKEIRDLIWALAKAEGTAVIVATHNPELAASADRVLRLVDGRVTEK
ncbi:MAG: hypothetical protein A2901_01080 [Elusimicrobia bacterium RIFCSPLOWO2_01_FULL_54_10]|nr:MAG: hypothetical protein A2901_01080 [Elusimicrobia bacterium RIFCSPLOWO2_01_FULL_54_10]